MPRHATLNRQMLIPFNPALLRLNDELRDYNRADLASRRDLERMQNGLMQSFAMPWDADDDQPNDQNTTA
jgi:hypothetical protein